MFLSVIFFKFLIVTNVFVFYSSLLHNSLFCILFLQEVETDQFFNFFLPELKNEGYDGIFSPKSRAKHMSENERKYVDGCAIFWRTSK